MRVDEPRVPVAQLRDAVREAIESTSSHVVARDVGLTAPSIRAFVAGSEPRPSTIRKLTTWYLRYRRRTAGGTLDAGTAAAAVALLLEHIPAPRREKVHAELYQWLEQRSKQTRAGTPAWVSEARARIRKKK
jgi:hypothetical protein